mmetsp:Transcript_43195/g.100090  ORF Transcript_43195/g.100090 Transcript_43195/m.100090 type:complete len:246 (+) Transcript_43195:260-997(+)
MVWTVPAATSFLRAPLNISSTSSSSSSISDNTSESVLLRTKKNGTFHFWSSFTSINSASVKRVAVMRTTTSKYRMPMSLMYVACGQFGVPTPGRSQITHSARTPVNWSLLALITLPSASLTSQELGPSFATTSATWPLKPPPTPRRSTRSPTCMGSSSGSFWAKSDLPTPRPLSRTRPKVLRISPWRGGKANISGCRVVSVIPVFAAPASFGLILLTALIQEDLPTPEAPVTAIITFPCWCEAWR